MIGIYLQAWRSSQYKILSLLVSSSNTSLLCEAMESSSLYIDSVHKDQSTVKPHLLSHQAFGCCHYSNTTNAWIWLCTQKYRLYINLHLQVIHDHYV